MRFTRFAVIGLVAVFLLVGCAPSPDESTSSGSAVEDESVASVSVPGIDMSLEVTRTVISRGERVPFRVTVKNTADVPFDTADTRLEVYVDQSEDGDTLGIVGYASNYGAPLNPLYLRSGETTTIDLSMNIGPDWQRTDGTVLEEVFVRARFMDLTTSYLHVRIE